MSTHIKIFSQQDIQDFDAVPKLSGEDRKKFFYTPIWAKEILKELKTPINKLGFTLQLGYFMASNKFFSSKSFDQQDVNLIVAKLPSFRSRINLSNYTDTNLKRHKEIILSNLGWSKFDKNAKKLLAAEAAILCSKQTKPRLMFVSLVEFLRYKKIEVPTYHAISEIITQSLNEFERRLILLLKKNLASNDQEILERYGCMQVNLLEKYDESHGSLLTSPVERTLITRDPLPITPPEEESFVWRSNHAPTLNMSGNPTFAETVTGKRITEPEQERT